MGILDTNLTVAVRCAECGRIKFHSISTFELHSNKRMEFYCDCNKLELVLTLKDNKSIVLDIPCIACEIVHTYKYSLKEIFKRHVTIVCCPDTEFELCFLGRFEDTRNIVYKYQEGMNQLLGELGIPQIIEGSNLNDINKVP